MPVFTEHSSSSRDLRVLPSFAPPLPRLAPPFERNEENEEKYEAVVVGVCDLQYPGYQHGIQHSNEKETNPNIDRYLGWTSRPNAKPPPLPLWS